MGRLLRLILPLAAPQFRQTEPVVRTKALVQARPLETAAVSTGGAVPRPITAAQDAILRLVLARAVRLHRQPLQPRQCQTMAPVAPRVALPVQARHLVTAVVSMDGAGRLQDIVVPGAMVRLEPVRKGLVKKTHGSIMSYGKGA
jgi:hypothetical protein